jgi:hypothetical protein
MTDFSVISDGGSVVLLLPRNAEARAWIAQNIDKDSTKLGDAVGVEVRYLADLVAGIESDGLSVS